MDVPQKKIGKPNDPIAHRNGDPPKDHSPPHLRTLEQLVQEWQRGHVTALQEIADRYYLEIWKICKKICRSPEEAEDLAQDTWLKICKSSGPRNAKSFIPWARRVALRSLINLKRKKSASPLFSETEEDTLSEIADPERDTQKYVLALLEREAVQEAVKRLPEAEKSVIFFRYFLGISVEETATCLKCSAKTVHNRTVRALQRLRKDLEDQGLNTQVIRDPNI